MKRVQILLEERDVKTLRRVARQTSKSYSLLVREAIETTYTSRFSETEIEEMSVDARAGKHTKIFKDLKRARHYLWGL